VPTQADLSSAIPTLGICTAPNVPVEFAFFKFLFDLPNDREFATVLYNSLAHAVTTRLMHEEIIYPGKGLSGCRRRLNAVLFTSRRIHAGNQLQRAILP
jgi:hypothetical protein